MKDEWFDQIARILATPVRRRKAGRIIATTLVASLSGLFRPREALGAAAQLGEGDDLIGALVARLLADPTGLDRNELMRIGLVDRLSRQTGLSFEALWKKLQKLSLLHQAGRLPTTPVDETPVEISITLSPGERATEHCFLPGPRGIASVRLTNSSAETVVVSLESGGLLTTKILGPGDFIEISDPVLLELCVLVTAIVLVTGLVVAIVTPGDRTVPGPPCVLQDNTIRCNNCEGSCAPPGNCVGVSFERCYLVLTEPNQCACR